MITNTTRIPMLDPADEVAEHWEALQAAFAAVLRSGAYVMGPQVHAFEREVADLLGVRHAIGVNSGTDALVIALESLGIGPGDEVITTPMTFFATAEAIGRLGATPVFVDVEPDTANISAEAAAAAITPRTRALLPVHLYGQSADMHALSALAENHGLALVEDVAQALGGAHADRPLGAIGDAGALSFFPSKNLGGYGDGGMVVTNNDAAAERARMLRVHGAKRKYHNEILGYNSRLDELQAALLRVKLPHLARQNARRREAAQRYDRLLAGVEGVSPLAVRAEAFHVYHQYTVRVANRARERVQTRLAEAGIATMIYYPVPVHCLPLYAAERPCLPTAERLSAEVLSLPIWPGIAEPTQVRIVQALVDALE
ncbi:MAG TPA: DegT/DnrJ/EryC1/StrS family aminotransferase [Oscillatoriaceae cyanobacterium]